MNQLACCIVLQFFCILGSMIAVASPLPVIAAEAGQTVQADGQTDDGFRQLFNGRNLDGWYTFLQKHGRDSDPDKIITIENGLIHLYKHATHGDHVVQGFEGLVGLPAALELGRQGVLRKGLIRLDGTAGIVRLLET